MVIATPLSRSRHVRSRWAVIAPHPDDETIGTGALIAQVAAVRRLGFVAFLTDGSGSHPRGGSRLTRCRAREAALALRRLGAATPSFLGWQDGHAPATGTPEHRATVRCLAALFRRHRIDAVAVTPADETHGDHVAAHALVRAAVASARRPVAIFLYRVWGGPMPHTHRPPLSTEPIAAGRRRHALGAHRSQLTAALGPGFRVPPPLRRPRPRDILHRDMTP